MVLMDHQRSFGSSEKTFSINFTKGDTKFCLSLRYNAANSYLFVVVFLI